MKTAGFSSLTPAQAAQIDALAAMPESAIDTSDIPEVTDWSGARRGMFAALVAERDLAGEANAGVVHGGQGRHERWLVRLSGEPYDLRRLQDVMKPPFDPWCEQLVRDGDSISVLRSERFDAARDAAEVRQIATGLVDQMNGALLVLADAGPVKFESVGRIEDSGSISFTVFAVAHMSARARSEARGELRDAQGRLVPPPPPERSRVQAWIGAAEDELDIGDMLVFASRANNWFDIYKAIELAERLSGKPGVRGHEHDLLSLMGEDRKSCKNMKETANHFRHARGHLPSKPISLPEANMILPIMIKKVLLHRGL